NSSDTMICEGDVLVLDAGEHPKNPIYIWNNGLLTKTIPVSSPGTYHVKVQNTDGCMAWDTVIVSVLPLPIGQNIAIIDNGDCSFTFNIMGEDHAEEFLWDFGDGATTT